MEFSVPIDAMLAMFAARPQQKKGKKFERHEDTNNCVSIGRHEGASRDVQVGERVTRTVEFSSSLKGSSQSCTSCLLVRLIFLLPLLLPPRAARRLFCSLGQYLQHPGEPPLLQSHI